MKHIYTCLVFIVAVLVMCSCGGSSSPSNDVTNKPATAAVSGEAIYKKTCITCHQANGEGLTSTYPPLAKSDFLADKEKTIGQVIKGFMGEMVVNGVKYNNVMPAQPLSDEEIAAVLTYVNSHFGNSNGPVTADDVKAVRAK